MKRRECLAGRVERSITGEDLITELNRLAADRGTYPAVLRCDKTTKQPPRAGATQIAKDP
ncbi:MAG: putative transposase [Mycobacterium sp.]|jgi:hypothetical protein|nr:putative transposase [Mycobacterium sp.]